VSGTSTIPGTNVAPVSFPGIASGIDYNAIITKLTSLSLSPTVSMNQHIATLNAANAELIKINGMLASVQNALTALSQSDLYGAVSAISSNTSEAAALGITGVYATPGSYTIDATTLATPTIVTGASNMGHVITDAMPGTTTSGADVPLADSWAAIKPSNGAGATGTVTINGVSVSYDVTTQSLNTILANINAAEAAAGDASFNISLSGNTVQITDGSKPISLGSQADQGNLLQVLRLDQAQIVNTPTSGSVTGTGGVGGISDTLDFNSANALGQSTNANYLTAVTSGSFTINGVKISVDVTKDNLADVVSRINASSAGVVAAYNSATGQITLAAKNTGPQSIVLGSGSDTSNFLTASGLTTASGATVTIGKQASVTVQNPAGGTQTVYSSSNSVTTAIPGVQLNLIAPASSPFQVTVAPDSSGLVSAINTFISAYNTAIDEINIATSPPVVASGSFGSGPNASAAVGAGILYGNSDVGLIKDELVNMVSGYDPNASTGYNSLSTIGLTLTDSFTQLAQNANAGSGGQLITTQTLSGTDGELKPLDVTKLQNALAANPSAVQSLFSGSSGLVQQMGSYLTGVTGMPTSTATALLGAIPTVSLIQGFENTNTSNIDTIQQQIKQIQDNVNMQADQLRQEFTATEGQLAQLQALQTQLGSFFKNGG
jgi:flagellar hook-associated protein 2